VGRRSELARLQELLDDDPPASIVLLHGPAGIGKSALMREFARRAQAHGATPVAVEARDVAPLAEAIDAAVAPALDARRPLLLLDSWERLSALDAHLRGEVLPRLPSDALVVIASRRAPGSGWFATGWEHLVLELALAPLEGREAEALLAARGVTDRELLDAHVAWAAGSPLALVLAADAGAPPPANAVADAPPALADALLRGLLEQLPTGETYSVLALAALARVTTPELIAAALPQADAQREYARLREHPSVEALGEGVTLHDLVGRALRADLRRRTPELERELRRRLADALYARSASDGLLQLTLDLQHLVQNPAIRWGFSWDVSGRYRIDSPRAGDLDAIAARSGSAALDWLAAARPYFEAAPERVTVVRDQDDAIAGYGVGATPANAPEFAADDPVLGPRIEHASRHVPGGAAIVWRQAVDLTHDPSSPVTALIGMAGVIGSGLANPAAAYLPIAGGDASAQRFSAACGARPVEQLAVEHAGVRLECHVLDYGPGGLLAFQRAAVYRELGLAPAWPTLDAVRSALRDYGSPSLLARCALAPADGSPAARAASVRAQIDDAVRDAFGTSPDDELLRRVLARAYLDPALTHEQAADELHLSRAAYFRRLRTAVERVAEQLAPQAQMRD
jgi:hypothetical protein